MTEVGQTVVYLNGNFETLTQTRISPLDYGFLYGYGLFETMRAYGGRIFLLEQHLERLYRSAEELGFPLLLPKEELAAATERTLTANGLRDARIRLTVSPGEGEMVPDLNTCEKPTILVTVQKYTPISHETYLMGFQAILSAYRRDSQSLLSRLKTCNYLGSFLARSEARRRKADEAVMLNEKGLVAECSASNLFLVKDNLLYTPPVESGLLPGITRQIVLELAQRNGIDVKIQELPLEMLKNADEAFITNSIMELMPLTFFDNSPLGKGKLGPITLKLMEAYSRLTR